MPNDVPSAELMILVHIVPLALLVAAVLLFLRYKVIPKPLQKPFDWLMDILTFFK